jgi:hypothetical protein
VEEKKKAIAVISALPGVGHFSAAIINVTMGLLAGLVALGLRGETPDARMVMRALRELPFGPMLMIVTAAGAVCLAVWRILQAVWDLEGKGRGFIGLCQRGRYLFGAVFYLSVPILVTRMLFGLQPRSGGQLAREAASAVIGFPFGWSIVLGTGMGFLAAGCFYIYKMCRGNFEGVFYCDQMTEKQRKLCFAFGRLGCAARAMIFLVVGYYLMVAGWNVDPRQVEGQAGALQIIAQQPFGPMMLGVVALGLIGFGVFSLAESRYGRIPRDKVTQRVDRAVSS